MINICFRKSKGLKLLDLEYGTFFRHNDGLFLRVKTREIIEFLKSSTGNDIKRWIDRDSEFTDPIELVDLSIEVFPKGTMK